MGELSFTILKKKIQIRPVNHCVFLDIDNQRIYLLISYRYYRGFCMVVFVGVHTCFTIILVPRNLELTKIWKGEEGASRMLVVDLYHHHESS